MNEATDTNRALGRVEGNQTSAELRMNRFEVIVLRGFDDIKHELTKVNDRLTAIETAESQRTGAFKLGQWIAGVVGAGVALLFEHFWR